MGPESGSSSTEESHSESDRKDLVLGEQVFTALEESIFRAVKRYREESVSNSAPDAAARLEESVRQAIGDAKSKVPDKAVLRLCTPLRSTNLRRMGGKRNGKATTNQGTIFCTPSRKGKPDETGNCPGSTSYSDDEMAQDCVGSVLGVLGNVQATHCNLSFHFPSSPIKIPLETYRKSPEVRTSWTRGERASREAFTKSAPRTVGKKSDDRDSRNPVRTGSPDQSTAWKKRTRSVGRFEGEDGSRRAPLVRPQVDLEISRGRRESNTSQGWASKIPEMMTPAPGTDKLNRPTSSTNRWSAATDSLVDPTIRCPKHRPLRRGPKPLNLSRGSSRPYNPLATEGGGNRLVHGDDRIDAHEEITSGSPTQSTASPQSQGDRTQAMYPYRETSPKMSITVSELRLDGRSSDLPDLASEPKSSVCSTRPSIHEVSKSERSPSQDSPSPALLLSNSLRRGIRDSSTSGDVQSKLGNGSRDKRKGDSESETMDRRGGTKILKTSRAGRAWGPDSTSH